MQAIAASGLKSTGRSTSDYLVDLLPVLPGAALAVPACQNG